MKGFCNAKLLMQKVWRVCIHRTERSSCIASSPRARFETLWSLPKRPKHGMQMRTGHSLARANEVRAWVQFSMPNMGGHSEAMRQRCAQQSAVWPQDWPQHERCGVKMVGTLQALSLSSFPARAVSVRWPDRPLLWVTKDVRVQRRMHLASHRRLRLPRK